MPGYTGHVKGMYDVIGVTPIHAQYKAMVKGSSEMDPSSKIPVPHPSRDPCNRPTTTFRKVSRMEDLSPSFATRPKSAFAKGASNRSHIVMGDDRFFQTRSQYNDSHADAVRATGMTPVMDLDVLNLRNPPRAPTPAAPPPRIVDLSQVERERKYAAVKRALDDLALEQLEKNMRLRLSAKMTNDNVNGKRMLRMFTQFDTDGSGFIEFEEFHKGLLSYGIQLETEQALRLFTKYDKDHSGYMSYTDFMEQILEPEYFQLAFNYGTGMSAEARKSQKEAYLHKRLVKRVKELRHLFARRPEWRHYFDADNSGLITHDEFGQALRKIGLHLMPADFEALYHALDDDKSGKISIVEFDRLLVE